jgi:hypothetical protein
VRTIMPSRIVKVEVFRGLYLDSIASDKMFRRRHDHVLTYLDELVRLGLYGLPALEKVDDHPLRLFSTIDPWHFSGAAP